MSSPRAEITQEREHAVERSKAFGPVQTFVRSLLCNPKQVLTDPKLHLLIYEIGMMIFISWIVVRVNK